MPITFNNEHKLGGTTQLIHRHPVTVNLDASSYIKLYDCTLTHNMPSVPKIIQIPCKVMFGPSKGLFRRCLGNQTPIQKVFGRLGLYQPKTFCWERKTYSSICKSSSRRAAKSLLNSRASRKVSEKSRVMSSGAFLGAKRSAGRWLVGVLVLVKTEVLLAEGGLHDTVEKDCQVVMCYALDLFVLHA